MVSAPPPVADRPCGLGESYAFINKLVEHVVDRTIWVTGYQQADFIQL
jgi:hypothetical protein